MNVLIAAGGTGQEVALSVLRLCYLAGLEYPRIIVFDSDTAQRQPEEGAESRMQALQALDQHLRDLGACDGDRLHLLNPSATPNLTQRIEKVEDLYSMTGNLHPDDKAMLSILLDSHQRRSRVDNGFHGEPAVGSLLFEGALARGTFRTLEQQLRDWAKSDKGLRVVLAGSVSGGVGTAVLPAISRLLERIKKDHPKVATLGVLQLPWFHLKRVDGDHLSAEPDVNAAQFDRNTACLVRGFLNDIEKKRGLDTLMLLGLPRRVERVSHGGDRQLETLHYLCVCAGIVAANLLDPRATRSFLGDQSHGLFGLSLRNSKMPSAFDGPPAGPTLYRPEGNLNIKQLIDIARSLRAYTRQFALELECDSPTSMHHATVHDALSVLENACRPHTLDKSHIQG